MKAAKLVRLNPVGIPFPMSENLDDDEAASFESAAPVQNKSLTESTLDPVRDPSPAKAAILAYPEPANDNSGELSLVSALLNTKSSLIPDVLRQIPVAVWQDPEARAVMGALDTGVDPDDLLVLCEKTGIAIQRLLAILVIDREGASFSQNRRILRDRARNRKILSLATALAADPDRGEIIAAQLVKIMQDGSEVRRLPAKGVLDFKCVPQDDRSCLLGNRYLNRGDGMVLVGNSGMGKSSMMLQMAVIFALGLPFFGLQPNGPIKSLIIQSEDSEGDIAEVMASITHVLKLTPAQIETVHRNVIIVSDRIHRGKAFIDELRGHIQDHQPDLVWINPLASFIDGDISDAQQAGAFLREQLNGLNADCQFGYVIVHHTTKPAAPVKGAGETKWNNEQYGMAGSYEVIGWARAILILKASDNPGDFELILAKRGTRADVKIQTESEAGIPCLERTTRITLKHATGTFTPSPLTKPIPLVFWEERKLPKSELVAKGPGGRKPSHSFSDFLPIFSHDRSKASGLRALIRAANEIKTIGNNSFEQILKNAVIDGMLTKDLSDPLQPKYYLNSNPLVSEPQNEPPFG